MTPQRQPAAETRRAFDCGRCGQRHPRGCIGHVEECQACGERRDVVVGRPCQHCGADKVVERACWQSPRRGAEVCGSHGGAAPQVVAAGQRRDDERRARALAARTVAELGEVLGVDDSTDSLEVLEARLRHDEQLARAFVWMVGELQIEPGAGGLVGPDHLGDLRLHPAATGALAASRQARDTAKAIAELNLEERKTRLAERDARLLADRMRLFLDGVRARMVAEVERSGSLDLAGVERVWSHERDLVEEAWKATAIDARSVAS